jgi:thiosulfate/3-mercaptopyruvate sulfurtransferase
MYAHLDRDLSGIKTGRNGRHPLPDPDRLAATLGAWGIDRSSQVVAYDQDTGMYASRLWWLLRWLGHDEVAVLDGGFAKWTAEGRPVESTEAGRRLRVFEPAPRSELIATMDEVSASARNGLRLVDARAPERYRGDIEPIDPVAGHIPGAANHFFRRNVREDGSFRSSEELQREWSETLQDASPDRVVCYCGSGVTACHDLLALEHIGVKGARLYPGSWSEWCYEKLRN